MLEKMAIILGLCIVIFGLTYLIVKGINSIIELRRIDKILSFIESRAEGQSIKDRLMEVRDSIKEDK